MSSDTYPGEDNPSYAYDPAQRQRRDRWRRAVIIAEGVRPALAVVFTACSAVVLISSIGVLTGATGGLMGSRALEAEVPEPSLWATLRQSGALPIMALLGGFMLFSSRRRSGAARTGARPSTPRCRPASTATGTRCRTRRTALSPGAWAQSSP